MLFLVPVQQAFNNIVVDLDFAQREDFYFGAKLVRGAYMEQVCYRQHQLGLGWVWCVVWWVCDVVCRCGVVGVWCAGSLHGAGMLPPASAGCGVVWVWCGGCVVCRKPTWSRYATASIS